jgi:hypothetical protein
MLSPTGKMGQTEARLRGSTEAPSAFERFPVPLAGVHPVTAAVGGPEGARHTGGSGQCSGPPSWAWLTKRKQRPAIGENASA